MKLNWLLLILSISLFLVGQNKPPQALTLTEKEKVFKIAVISDLNSSYGAVHYNPDVKATLKELDSIKPDLILCAGDMVAGQKAALTTAQLANMWESFRTNVLMPINEMKIPFGFTVGNHDAAPNFLKDREMAQQFWKENQQHVGLDFVDQTHYPFYYSYIKNEVFFVSWDAAGSTVKPEVQEWMVKTLQSKKAKKAKLRIVLGHLPLIAIVDAKNKAGEVLANTVQITDLFKNNGVDLYISGHQHAYYPAKFKGLNLLNAGCIGEGPRQLIGDSSPARRAYTLIEIPAKAYASFKYRSFIPAKNEEIQLRMLPDSVVGFNGVVKLEKDRSVEIH